MPKLLLSLLVAAVSLPAQNVDFAFHPDFAKNGIVLIPYNSSPTFTTDAESAFRGQYPQASAEDVDLLHAILPYSFLLTNHSGRTINVYSAQWITTDKAGHTEVQRHGCNALRPAAPDRYWIPHGEERLITPVLESADLNNGGPKRWGGAIYQSLNFLAGRGKVEISLDLAIFDNWLIMGPDAINRSSMLLATFGAAKEVSTEVARLWRATSRTEPVTQYLTQVAKDAPSLRLLNKAHTMSREGAYDFYVQIEKGRLARSWLASSASDFDRALRGAQRDAALEMPVLHR
jgi:hypothetical protein